MIVDKRISKTNRAIQLAFVDLAQIMPIEKITITALAGQAHISRKTFYDRYSSIEDLALSLREDLITEFKGVLVPPITDDGEIDQNSVAKFIYFAKTHKELLRIMNEDDERFLQVAVDKRSEDFTNYLVDSGKFEKSAAKTIAPWLITFYFRGLSNLTSRWLFTDNDLSDEDMTKLVMMLFKTPLLPNLILPKPKNS